MMLEHAIRILSEPAIVGAPGRLHVGDAPRFRTEHPQKRLGMRRPGADLQIERLLDDAPLRRPECGQLENEVLEGHDRYISFSTFTDLGSRSRCMAIRLRCIPSSSRSAVG